MSLEKLEACVKHLHEQQTIDRAQYKDTWKARLATQEKQKSDAEARCQAIAKKKAKEEVAKARPSKVVSKPIVHATTQEVDVSIPTPIHETPMEKANEAITDPTSHKATSKDTTVVIVHTTTS